jgi:protein Tob/BTG
MSATSNLSTTLAQAIAYLTRPLTITHPAATINKLQSVLEANLTALFAPTWTPKEPLRGSGQRCLTLSPNCLPPRAIYTACLASKVHWFDWIASLGGREFDFHVDPGCISVRFGRGTKIITIWADEPIAKAVSVARHTPFSLLPNNSRSKTLAQQLWENDRTEDEELFALIADEINAPTWMTPTNKRFPAPARSESPLSAISTDSCSSYCSSDLCSCFSATSTSTLSSKKSSKQSSRLTRREKATQARVFVDTSKTEVTPYDGGKTTVLTGGVMLGAALPKGKSGPSTSAWRCA